MLNHTVRIAIFRLVFWVPVGRLHHSTGVASAILLLVVGYRPSVMLVLSRNGRNQSQHKLAQNSPFIPLSPKVRQPGPRCCSTAEPHRSPQR